MTPAAEENSTNALRSISRVSSCRCSAASTFGRITRSTRSGVSDAITPSSSTPAACTTPDSSRPASSAATASRSATSHAATSTSAPRPVSSATSSAAPGVSAPRRPVSSSRRTPYSVTRCRAIRAPSTPDPARDQHRVAEHRRRFVLRPRWFGQPGEPRGVEGVPAHHDPGLPGRARRRDGGVVVVPVGGVQVHQDEPAGVLGLGAADQAPDRRRGQVGGVLTGHRDRAPCDHRQTRGGRLERLQPRITAVTHIGTRRRRAAPRCRWWPCPRRRGAGPRPRGRAIRCGVRSVRR